MKMLYVCMCYIFCFASTVVIDVRDVLAEVGRVPVVGAFRLLGSQLAGGGGAAQSVAAPNCVGPRQGLRSTVPHYSEWPRNQKKIKKKVSGGWWVGVSQMVGLSNEKKGFVCLSNKKTYA